MTGQLISVQALSKSFAGPDGRSVPVLDGITLSVDEGEFVALLGRSGSGKSTLLRCIAGLIAPSDGEVLFRGKRLTGCNRDTTMVFQTFALLPWLTVQQNVEIGLEARGVPPAERSRRALHVIDIVGLDGYESAYPKELSGGMRQRVGFARALVVEPAALLMDEPFSALDVLTAENLRGELLELWEGQRFPTKAIVMVTHNIEEAVLLADRILVLGTNPGRIRADMRNPLARPRRRRTPDYEALVDQIYRMMTQRDSAPAVPAAQPAAGPGRSAIRRCRRRPSTDCPAWPRSCSGGTMARPTSLTWPTIWAWRSTTCCRWSTRSCCSGSPSSAVSGWLCPAAAGSSPARASRTARRSSPGPRWTARPWCARSIAPCGAAWTACCPLASSPMCCAPATARTRPPGSWT